MTKEESKKKKTKTLGTSIRDLKEYEGPDKVVSSFDLDEILKQIGGYDYILKSKIPLLDYHLDGGFEAGELLCRQEGKHVERIKVFGFGYSENTEGIAMTHYTEEDYRIFLQRRKRFPNHFSDKANPDPGSESHLLSKCLSYCKERGFPAWHDRSRGKNKPGWPDLQVYLPGGKVILIELKSAQGIFRKEQEKLAREFMYLKHRYFKIRSFTRFLQIMEEEILRPREKRDG